MRQAQCRVVTTGNMCHSIADERDRDGTGALLFRCPKRHQFRIAIAEVDEVPEDEVIPRTVDVPPPSTCPPDPPLSGSEACELRDEGIERVDEHASTDWKSLADSAIRLTCENMPHFIVDDVWERLGSRPDGDARAMGPAIMRASRKGWCEKTSDYRASDQPRCHKNPRRVWRSLLFEGYTPPAQE